MYTRHNINNLILPKKKKKERMHVESRHIDTPVTIADPSHYRSNRKIRIEISTDMEISIKLGQGKSKTIVMDIELNIETPWTKNYIPTLTFQIALLIDEMTLTAFISQPKLQSIIHS
jgi:hypothetical protein